VEDVQRRLAAVGNPARVAVTQVNDRLVSALRDQRFRATLFGSFAIVALVLACVGLYAVTAFEVRLRRREMGVRLALGATPGRLHRFVLMSALWPVVGGAAGGGLIAWWAAEYLQAFVHQVDARDPGTLVLVSALLVAAGALAAWLPAREASRVDPATVLRSE
jgi:ABC-type antimicrobial peptide transport system permease subunit